MINLSRTSVSGAGLCLASIIVLVFSQTPIIHSAKLTNELQKDSTFSSSPMMINDNPSKNLPAASMARLINFRHPQDVVHQEARGTAARSMGGIFNSGRKLELSKARSSRHQLFQQKSNERSKRLTIPSESCPCSEQDQVEGNTSDLNGDDNDGGEAEGVARAGSPLIGNLLSTAGEAVKGGVGAVGGTTSTLLNGLGNVASNALNNVGSSLAGKEVPDLNVEVSQNTGGPAKNNKNNNIGGGKKQNGHNPARAGVPSVGGILGSVGKVTQGGSNIVNNAVGGVGKTASSLVSGAGDAINGVIDTTSDTLTTTSSAAGNSLNEVTNSVPGISANLSVDTDDQENNNNVVASSPKAGAPSVGGILGGVGGLAGTKGKLIRNVIGGSNNAISNLVNGAGKMNLGNLKIGGESGAPLIGGILNQGGANGQSVRNGLGSAGKVVGNVVNGAGDLLNGLGVRLPGIKNTGGNLMGGRKTNPAVNPTLDLEIVSAADSASDVEPEVQVATGERENNNVDSATTPGLVSELQVETPAGTADQEVNNEANIQENNNSDTVVTPGAVSGSESEVSVVTSDQEVSDNGDGSQRSGSPSTGGVSELKVGVGSPSIKVEESNLATVGGGDNESRGVAGGLNNELSGLVEDGAKKYHMRCQLEPIGSTTTGRQLSLPANSLQQSDNLLDRLQKGLLEGRNSIENRINERLGISVPTKVMEKEESRVELNDEGAEKLENTTETTSRRAIRNKIADLSFRHKITTLALKIIQRIIKLVTGRISLESKSLLTEILEQIFKAFSKIA